MATMAGFGGAEEKLRCCCGAAFGSNVALAAAAGWDGRRRDGSAASPREGHDTRGVGDQFRGPLRISAFFSPTRPNMFVLWRGAS